MYEINEHERKIYSMVHEELIADFLGWKKSLGITYHKNKKVTTKKYFDFANNNDWNGLMEVIEKIESLGYRIAITPFSTEISNEILDIKSWKEKTKIKNTYNACVEFINQLNN